MGGTVAPAFGSELDAFLDHMADIFITTSQRLKANQKEITVILLAAGPFRRSGLRFPSICRRVEE